MHRLENELIVISLYTMSLSLSWDMVCMIYFLILSFQNNFTNNSKCNNLLHHCLLNVSSFPFLHDVIKCTNKSKTLMVFLSNSVLLSLKNQTNGVNRIVNFTNSYLFFPFSVWMTHTLVYINIIHFIKPQNVCSKIFPDKYNCLKSNVEFATPKNVHDSTVF